MKTCSKCGIEKDFSEFYKDISRKDGIQNYCKSCKKKDDIKRKKINKIKNTGHPLIKKLKKCPKCKKTNPSDEFYKDKTRKDGYACHCKTCSKKAFVKHKKQNPTYYKIYNKKNENKIKKYHEKWKEAKALYIGESSKAIAWHDYTECSEDGYLITKCKYCGKKFIPKKDDVRNRAHRLNDNGSDTCGLYCSSGCKKACPIYRQVKHYRGQKIEGTSRETRPELRQMCLERDAYTCQKCGAKGKTVQLHCHHIKAVADDPIESADVDNTITYCKDCHKEAHKMAGCGYHELRCNAA